MCFAHVTGVAKGPSTFAQLQGECSVRVTYGQSAPHLLRVQDLQVVWLSPGHHRRLDLIIPDAPIAAMAAIGLAVLVCDGPPA